MRGLNKIYPLKGGVDTEFYSGGNLITSDIDGEATLAYCN